MELTLDQALQKGVEAHKTGKVQEADRYYTAILKAQPNHPDANHNMGVLAVGVGKVEEALPFFKTALEANSTIPQFWLSYINALIKLDRMIDAKAVFEKAKRKGVKGDGFDKLKQQLKLSEKIEATDNGTRKLLEPTQKQLQALFDLYSQGQYQETLNLALQTAKKFPESVDLYNIIGVSNKVLGKIEKAIEAYKKALALKPDYPEAYHNLGNALKDQDSIDEAIVAYKKALALKPDYSEAYNNLGNALRDQGNIDEALAAYKKAVALKPYNAITHNNMGVAFKNRGNLEGAIKAYNQAVSIKPDFAEAYNNMGNALKSHGKTEDAIKAYKKAISIKPDYAEAYYNMGVSLGEQDKFEKAIETYNKVLSIEPNHQRTQHMLSSLLGNTTKTAPKEYVQNLFDEYASNFEESLVSDLEYQIPKLTSKLLINFRNNQSLGSVLDLGCGTGLFGSEVVNYCSRLEGIDISKKMLELARQKNVYDKLDCYDITDYLHNEQVDFNYYIALDVFIYIGDLTEIFRLIKSKNRRSGKLVFCTEHTEIDGYHILKTGRYSHSKTYVESLCKKFGYKISHFSTTTLRKERGAYLTGGIYILEFG